jgi:hypothetical protein
VIVVRVRRVAALRKPMTDDVLIADAARRVEAMASRGGN